MLPNNEVRVPPPRAVAQSAALRDITAEFTDAASSKVDHIPMTLGLILTFFLSDRTTNWSTR